MTVSCSVGTSGSVVLRSRVSTASGRIFCALSCGSAVPKSGTISGMWPATRSVMAAGLLR
jgi:hypothetical protein